MSVQKSALRKGEPHRISATSVTITQRRWDVRFDIETPDGTQSFIASADAFFTDHDHIWIGTIEEHEEAQNNPW